MADAPSSHRVDVEGCSIHFLRWGPPEGTLPGILFLHGGGAHARWWSFIAPFFDHDRRVQHSTSLAWAIAGAGRNTAVTFMCPKYPR